MILVDSCIYIEHLRGMRTPKARAALEAYFNCLLYIPTPNHIWEAAENLLWQTDRKGFKIPLTDAVIAVCAMKAGGAVLTRDIHFSAIPGLRVLEHFPD